MRKQLDEWLSEIFGSKNECDFSYGDMLQAYRKGKDEAGREISDYIQDQKETLISKERTKGSLQLWIMKQFNLRYNNSGD